jgi:hypothetical protein
MKTPHRGPSISGPPNPRTTPFNGLWRFLMGWTSPQNLCLLPWSPLPPILTAFSRCSRNSRIQKPVEGWWNPPPTPGPSGIPLAPGFGPPNSRTRPSAKLLKIGSPFNGGSLPAKPTEGELSARFLEVSDILTCGESGWPQGGEFHHHGGPGVGRFGGV